MIWIRDRRSTMKCWTPNSNDPGSLFFLLRCMCTLCRQFVGRTYGTICGILFMRNNFIQILNGGGMCTVVKMQRWKCPKIMHSRTISEKRILVVWSNLTIQVDGVANFQCFQFMHRSIEFHDSRCHFSQNPLKNWILSHRLSSQLTPLRSKYVYACSTVNNCV